MEFSARTPLPVIIRIGDSIRQTSVRTYVCVIGEVGVADDSLSRDMTIPEFLSELAESKVLSDSQKAAIRLTLGIT